VYFQYGDGRLIGICRRMTGNRYLGCYQAEEPALGVPAGPVSYLELAALPSAPFWARRQARAALRAWGLPEQLTQTAELLVSELVTNAIKVTSPAPGRLTYSDLAGAGRVSLTLRLLPRTLAIEVADNDDNPPVLTQPDDYDEGGRGLMLVDALSGQWGYYVPPAGGKVVFCVLGR
jgi:anti-sigma regulatory factor (Ser/Thr protein kinase)